MSDTLKRIVSAWVAVRPPESALPHSAVTWSTEGERVNLRPVSPLLWRELVDLAALADIDGVISGEYMTTPAAVPLLMTALGNPYPAAYTLSVRLEKDTGWRADIIARVSTSLRRGAGSTRYTPHPTPNLQTPAFTAAPPARQNGYMQARIARLTPA